MPDNQNISNEAFSSASEALTELTTVLRGTTLKLHEVAEAVKVIPSLEQSQLRTKRFTWALAVSFILDIALTIVVGILTSTAISNTHSIHNSQITQCNQANIVRADQVKIWNGLITVSNSRARLPGEDTAHYNARIAQINQFLGLVDSTFSPVDCAQLYGDGAGG
jgi:hypothetical protein